MVISQTQGTCNLFLKEADLFVRHVEISQTVIVTHLVLFKSSQQVG